MTRPSTPNGWLLSVAVLCGLSAAGLDLRAFQSSRTGSQPVPSSGAVPVAFSALDSTIAQLTAASGAPGVAVAITKGGRLVFARGYGYSSVEQRIRVEPDSLFRLASISKALTATAADKLVDLGRLRYDTKAFEILNRLLQPNELPRDPRLTEITVWQLMTHRSGWADEIGGNRYGDALRAAGQLRLAAPGTFEGLIRYVVARPLDYPPGSAMHYCNFCYGLLAEVIQAVSGKDYERFVIEDVLRRVQINRMRVGSHRQDQQARGEVTYYDPFAAPVASLYADTPGRVPVPYGGILIDWGTGSGAGGWIGSTIDVLRLVASVTLGRDPAMFGTRPRTGFAFSALPIGPGWIWRHNGAMPGSATTLHIRYDVAWSILTNTSDRGTALVDDIDNAIDAAVRRGLDWPETDLFPLFLSR